VWDFVLFLVDTAVIISSTLSAKATLSWEIAAMLAKVVVVGVRHIVARGAQDLTNYAIL
jgi:hypothetical protein